MIVSVLTWPVTVTTEKIGVGDHDDVNSDGTCDDDDVVMIRELVAATAGMIRVLGVLEVDVSVEGDVEEGTAVDDVDSMDGVDGVGGVNVVEGAELVDGV